MNELKWAVLGTGVIANEMGTNLRVTAGPAIVRCLQPNLRQSCIFR